MKASDSQGNSKIVEIRKVIQDDVMKSGQDLNDLFLRLVRGL